MDETVEQRLREDPTMALLIDEHGPIELSPAEYPFERLCTSIINQQLSTASASAIRERVFAHLDRPITPDAVADVEESILLDAGLSATKAEYLKSAATAFIDNGYEPSTFESMSDTAVVDELTDIRGVGEWTANMFLISVLGREDVFPIGDLAVRRGIEQIYGSGESMSREAMREIADGWRPFRSYGTRYIWREYESPATTVTSE